MVHNNLSMAWSSWELFKVIINIKGNSIDADYVPHLSILLIVVLFTPDLSNIIKNPISSPSKWKVKDYLHKPISMVYIFENA